MRDYNWLSEFITEYVPLQKGMKVLDLGCGTGIISGIINEMTQENVVAMDLSYNMIEFAKKKYDPSKIEFVNEDYYLTERTGFDMVICFNAYPHFVDVEAFKKKTKDILNKNGYLVVLHSLSRKQLSECHNGLSHNISRELLDVCFEIEPYKEMFEVMNTMDNDEMFMMLLKLKEE